MKKKPTLKQASALLLSLLLTALIPTGCGGSAPDASREPQASSPAPASSEQAKSIEITEPITIEFWHTVEEQYRGTLTSIIDDFQKENPLIKVDVVYSGSAADTSQKFIAANAAGGDSLPAAMVSSSDYIYDYATSGVMEELGPYFEADGIDTSDFAQGMLDTFSWEDKTYFVPFLNSACIWFYNKTAAEAEGIDMPATWDDMDAFLTKATKGDRTGIAFGGWNSFYTDTLFTNQGVVLKKEDGTTDVAEGEALKMSRQIQGWVSGKKAVWAYGKSASANARTAFAEGKVFAVTHSTGIYQTYLDLCDFEVGIWLQPTGKLSTVSEVGGTGLGVPSKISQEKKNAGWKLISFLSNAENNMKLVEATGYLPTRKSAIASDAGRAYLEKYPEYEKVFSKIDDIIPRLRGEGVDAFRSVWEDALGKALTENLDVKTVLEEQLPAMNAALAGK